MDRLRRRKRTIFLFLLPGLLFFVLVAAFPLFFTGVISTFNWGIGGPTKFLGLNNFIQLFVLDVTFQKALKNVFVLTIGCLCTQAPLAIFFAYMLQGSFPGQNFFKSVYFIPNMISSVATGLMWSFILHPEFGFVNGVLKLIGLHNFARPWLGDPQTAMVWVVFAIAWQYFGYHMIIYLAAMQGIEAELVESATIDGATSWQVFWKITLPLITPVMKVDFILIATGSMRTFDLLFTMTGGGPNHATEVISTMIYFRSFQGIQFGYGSAMAVMLIIFCLIITGIINRIFKPIEDGIL
jgi:raffinose/stachyose/melibiose transport system permease protein